MRVERGWVMEWTYLFFPSKSRGGRHTVVHETAWSLGQDSGGKQLPSNMVSSSSRLESARVGVFVWVVTQCASCTRAGRQLVARTVALVLSSLGLTCGTVIG
jgi:hypothetical protein